jgi:hypothetical protein
VGARLECSPTLCSVKPLARPPYHVDTRVWAPVAAACQIRSASTPKPLRKVCSHFKFEVDVRMVATVQAKRLMTQKFVRCAQKVSNGFPRWQLDTIKILVWPYTYTRNDLTYLVSF